jgi:hypothetical protein
MHLVRQAPQGSHDGLTVKEVLGEQVIQHYSEVVQISRDMASAAKMADGQRKYEDKRDDKNAERVYAEHAPKQEYLPERLAGSPRFLALQRAHQYETGVNEEKEHAKKTELYNAQPPDVGNSKNSHQVEAENVHNGY